MLNDSTVHPTHGKNYNSKYKKDGGETFIGRYPPSSDYKSNIGIPLTPGKFNNNYCIISSSASHTFGNVISAIEHYLIDIFPPGLFKTVSISTIVPHRQLLSTPKQLIKKRCPMLILSPIIDWGQDGNRLFGYTLQNEVQSSIKNSWANDALIQLFEDKRCSFKCNWMYNRWLLNIQGIIAFDTLNEQINWMNYFLNSHPIQRPFIINVPLETLLPKALINQISELTGIPVYDKSNCVGPFIQYLQSISTDPITYKLKSGSNSDQFFRYYQSPLDITITSAEVQDGIRDSQIKHLYEIIFNMRVEFVGTGYFFISSPRIKNARNSPKILHIDEDSSRIVTMYTDDINYRAFDVPPGWNILATPSVRFNEGDDEVSFDTVIDEQINRMIDYHLKHGINPNNLLSFQFRINSHILDIKNTWTIDWVNRKLKIFNADHHEFYRLLILVNKDYINNMIKDIYGLE